MKFGQNKEIMEFGVPIGQGSEDYAKLFLQSSIKTDPSIHWILCLDPYTNKDKLEEKIKTFKSHYRFVESPNLFPIKKGVDFRRYRYMGIRGGILLDHLIASSTSDIMGIFDIDMAFLHPNWAKIMISQIKDNCIACGSEPTIENSWRKYPSSMACVFNRKKFQEIGISYKKPTNPDETHVLVTEENQFIWNRPLGTKIYMEIGCEIPPKIAKSGYKVSLLESVRTSPETEVYKWENKPIIAHMTKSRSRVYNEHPDSIWWLNEVKLTAEGNGIQLEITS